ncbi:hypothetical protein BDV38DRAFT_268778 [Aspergillus pseudotamarii]|uniref:FAD-dependent oxidoreductase 2 FAD-binding domain-containing protein n=1 Tax=Aspergillus pseudotamarii TaxID=132259 RepID=A0A5N6T450_ASPPS|nr:uncharacterized protein BDV38DRAFT_268778 [Aspergillus pseudotamarii]KAE8141086.1 hypothetical protein BDV38DRAFT_268778 [Aspergillus pseudotamarii]
MAGDGTCRCPPKRHVYNPQRSGCLVVGSGNAGFASSISAAQAGAKRVLLIDKCPEEWAGGNTYFTAGAYRTVQKIHLTPYSENFLADLNKVCMGRSDLELAKTLIGDSNSTIKWLARQGIRFQLSFNRQALKTGDGGKVLIDDYRTAAERNRIQVIWPTRLVGIHSNLDGSFTVTTKTGDKKQVIRAGAVILAAGGLESKAQMRSQFLGPGWGFALVRGTPYSTGDCLEIAIGQLAVQPVGDWSGCHSVAWDVNANPNIDDCAASNEYTKSGYPLGLMLYVDGQRFVDEGIDLRSYTYAKFGRAILQQPEQLAFQVRDSQTSRWLRSEGYREERVEHITAQSLEELAEKCEQCGLHDREAFVRTIREYNGAVYAHRQENPSAKWNPAVKDGLSTQSSQKQLALAKSNWALPLDKASCLAVKVTCGITFTFRGLKVDPQAAQLAAASTGRPIPGIFCVGEMVGGLLYSNYSGGSGLTSGAVFGRRLGKAAAVVATNVLKRVSKEHGCPTCFI